MRPRHKAAEYGCRPRPGGVDARVASMRPRHKAAEYLRGTEAAISLGGGFNEAAA